MRDAPRNKIIAVAFESVSYNPFVERGCENNLVRIRDCFDDIAAYLHELTTPSCSFLTWLIVLGLNVVLTVHGLRHVANSEDTVTTSCAWLKHCFEGGVMIVVD